MSPKATNTPPPPNAPRLPPTATTPPKPTALTAEQEHENAGEHDPDETALDSNSTATRPTEEDTANTTAGGHDNPNTAKPAAPQKPPAPGCAPDSTAKHTKHLKRIPIHHTKTQTPPRTNQPQHPKKPRKHNKHKKQ